MKLTPTDPILEAEGVYAPYHGVDLLIARSNNSVFKNTFQRLQRPHQRQIERNKLDEDTSLDILSKAMGKGLLVGWKDPDGILKDDDGVAVVYSEEAAIVLMKEDFDCRTFVLEFANEQANYYVEESEQIVEKSKTNSSGNSDTVNT